LPRIFIPTVDFKGNQISITGEKAHYLVSVLRCQKGEDLTIIDGEGNCLETSLTKCDKKEVIAQVIEKSPCNLESHLDIILAQGMLKGEKMDMVIQKTTELGVKEIIPVITERSQIKETRKLDRWRKIAEEASRQSGRSVVPLLHEPVEFKDIFSIRTSPRGFIFYEEGGRKLSEAFSSLIPRPLSFLTVIGPEGGFTKEEVNLAEEKGLHVTSLGRRILRAETAAISAVALIQFVFGDMG
jgi:16S rRNA (uracil1498-N3)-methyltransferase